MGTPDFAVPSLQILIDAPDCDVVGVVTQPDRPAGRGQEVRMSPVKETALAAGIPMIQPEKVKEATAFEQIRLWQPDFLVVVAFGQILKQNLLDLPTIAPVNVHASLLPRWRGAAPIQASIRAGDVYSGITTMQMDAGMDTGPILLQDSIPIEPTETGQSLHDKLSPLGANLLIHTLRWLQSGSIAPHDQPNRPNLITIAPQLKKEDGEIRWSQSAEDIDRHVRAFTPWPGTYTFWKGKLLKIISGFPAALDGGVRPGQVRESNIVDIAPDTPIIIGTGSGVYIPTRLQLAGRQAVGVQDFLNGAPGFAFAQLGR
jgi:methionyl-tRNA formyltransferase